MSNKAIDKEYLLRQFKNLDEDILENKYTELTDIAPAFSTSESYEVGDYVSYEGVIYKCKIPHEGAWASADFTAIVLSDELGDATTVLNGTLVATDWANNTQTVTVQGISADTKGTIGLLDSATSAQIEAARNAKIVPTAVGTNSITFTCEETPSIDIPFGILVPGGQSGIDGYSPAITITEITGGHRINITDAEHTSGQNFNVMDGTPGQNGYSPAVTITEITGGHRVNITDSTHTSGQNFDVMDGAQGPKGDRASNLLSTKLQLKISDTFVGITWTGLTNFDGENIWTDGDNIYYSYGLINQYVLDKSTSTWSEKKWYNGGGHIKGSEIWTDGNNIYCSDNFGNQYVLDKTTSTWLTKTWNGYTGITGSNVWTDGENIYYSYNSNQYVLDKSTSTWNVKTWNGLTNFYGGNTWTDGDNIYYSDGSSIYQYVLNKSTSTWTTKTWNGLPNVLEGVGIWTDGDNIYYSYNDDTNFQYILNKSTSTWTVKNWNGLTDFYGGNTWTDGDNIYYSNGSSQYVLKKPLTTTTCLN